MGIVYAICDFSIGKFDMVYNWCVLYFLFSPYAVYSSC